MHQRTWLSLLTLPLIAAFTVPMFTRQVPRPVRAQQNAAATEDPLAGLADIQDVLAHISLNHVDVPDMEKTLAGGIQGALERVNLLNSYLSPAEAQMPPPGKGQTGLALLKDRLVAIVVGVVPDSPAAEAGFKIGDRIQRLGEDPIGSMSHWAMERRLSGPEGSEVAVLKAPGGTDATSSRIVLKKAALPSPKIEIKSDPTAFTVRLPDLEEGRADELEGIFKAADMGMPLVLDLRGCIGGSYGEAAKTASMLGFSGTFATMQEQGRPDIPLETAAAGPQMFPKIAILIGLGTIGPAETLAAALRQLGSEGADGQAAPKKIVFLGDRTIGHAVGLSRFHLKQGGAAELVTKRWAGASGLNLSAGSAGGRLSSSGLVPDYSLRGLADSEELLPRILEALEKGPTRPNQEAQAAAGQSAAPN